MRKHVTILRAPDGLDRDAFIADVVAANGGLEMFVTDPDPRPATLVACGEREAAGPVLASYEVDALTVWDEPIDGETYSMFAFFRPPTDVDGDAWIQPYREHAEVARVHHPGIRRYVQDVVLAQTAADRWTFSAISELHFAGRGEFRDRFWRDAGSQTVIEADFRRFSDPASARTILASRVSS